MKTKILATLLASATVGVCSSAAAFSSITNLDLAAATPFGGFDWAQNGTAVSTPGPVYATGQVVNTVFFADAVSIVNASGGNFATPNMVTTAPGGGGFAAGQYEYTIVANITEVITCLDGAPCNLAAFTATGGTWSIYYDNAALGNTKANQVAGTGFTDGDLLISGAIDPGFAGTFTAFLLGGQPAGTGIFSFTGDVLTTNATYITPDLISTEAISTLQFGRSTTNWTAATGTPNGALPASNIQFQADGNQAFVPEPGTLALLGIGLLGMVGGLRARRTA